MNLFNRLVQIVLAITAVLALSLPALAYSVPDDTIVYVTPTGTKYHREDCAYTGTVRSMTIKQAEVAGYEPCSRCDPDMLTGEYVSNWDGESGGSSTKDSSAPDRVNTSSSSTKEREFPLVLTIIAVAFGGFYALCIVWSAVVFLWGWISELVTKIKKHR